MTTLSGDILYVNRAFCTTTGYSRQEVLSHSAVSLGLWEALEPLHQAVARLERDGYFDAIELTLVGKQGQRRCLETSGSRVQLDGRDVMIMAARDVTEHRLAEASAERARQDLAKYFALSVDLLSISSVDGRLLRLNPAWEQVLGFPVAKLEGSLFVDLVHPDDRDATIGATRLLRDGQQVIDFQNRYRHADGSWRWLEWRSTSDGHGLIFAVARDITRRRQDEMALRAAEQAAERSREQLLSVSELAHIGHFAVHADTGAVTWTSELFRICGVDPHEFTPTLKSIWRFVFEEDVAALREAARLSTEAADAQRLHFRIVRPTGELRYCLAIVERADATSAPRTHVFGLVQDLTELRRAEDEQRKLEQQVMQSQKLESLGVLAGGIAHDFNNILTSILGNIDVALGELPSVNSARSSLEDAEKASRRAAELCRQMLAYSGKGRFVVQPLSLNDVVREMAHLLSVSISKRVVIQYVFASELPSVVADATQMRQVVMNLITNASEAIGGGSGTVTLTTGVMDCDDGYLRSAVGHGDALSPGPYAYLKVRDTGWAWTRRPRAHLRAVLHHEVHGARAGPCRGDGNRPRTQGCSARVLGAGPGDDLSDSVACSTPARRVHRGQAVPAQGLERPRADSHGG